ncbi:hypothetical protein DVH05_001260 [Phytophthora capsici]|nr:hypothetical protein DVH05_001260 [Phytophthora capsici]
MVSSRVVGLIHKYTSCLRPTATTDRSVQNHVNLLDAEVQNGDVLRLLQLFPALLEEYIAMCTERNVPIDSDDPHWSHNSPVMDKRHRHEGKLTSMEFSPSESTAVAPRKARVSLKEDEQLTEQLELIRDAFQSYKEGIYTNS